MQTHNNLEQGDQDYKLALLNKSKIINETIEIIDIKSCGGCPGKKAVVHSEELVNNKAEAIIFASKIPEDGTVIFVCPFGENMKVLVTEALGQKIKMI